ncbi:MAG TPA: hypothetical protein DDW29_16640 [Gammaproteobacteria bacterium]|nr:hypothetical protein [Gammaproteobacteria bacterium]
MELGLISLIRVLGKKTQLGFTMVVSRELIQQTPKNFMIIVNTLIVRSFIILGQEMVLQGMIQQ